MRTSGMSGAGGGCYRGEVMSPEAATLSGIVLDPRRECLVFTADFAARHNFAEEKGKQFDTCD